MHHRIIIQKAAATTAIPTQMALKRWAHAALIKKTLPIEMTLRIVDPDEIHHLNQTYRHKNKPTNVLSFPFNNTHQLPLKTPILGDIVICADIVNQEAHEQHKTAEAHWAHMVVHGVLHLLGYDHITDEEALEMESEEIHILHSLGFPNPYQTTEKGETHEG